jgi:hypothetical protein
MVSVARKQTVKPTAALTKSIRDHRARAKFPISFRLVSEQIAAAKRIAAAKSVGYLTQLRIWIAEGYAAKQNGRDSPVWRQHSGVPTLRPSGTTQTVARAFVGTYASVTALG